MEIGFTVTDDM